MQPLYKTDADQSHGAGMQAQQTAMPRAHLGCAPARLVFGCASSFQTGSDRQRGLNRGGYRDVGEPRKGDGNQGISPLDRSSKTGRKHAGGRKMSVWGRNASSARALGGSVKITPTSRGTAQAIIPRRVTAAAPVHLVPRAIPATASIGRKCRRDMSRSSTVLWQLIELNRETRRGDNREWRKSTATPTMSGSTGKSGAGVSAGRRATSAYSPDTFEPLTYERVA